ncbi:MAG: pyruvate kinase [Bacteroidetes bacterium]|nr:MAG: pyruvate kinase [Bacteroidota bacterium]
MKTPEFLMTKIIATLGPATNSVETICKLIEAGARVFRINFSHGEFCDFDEILENIRKAEKKTKTFVAILGDLSGPKIRVGKVIPEGILLQKDDEINFVKHTVIGGKGSEKNFSTTYPSFIDEVKPGHRVLLDDGNIELKCLSRKGKGDEAYLVCKVVVGNLLTSAKGVNLPDTELSVPSLTEKDRGCVKYAVRKGFDFLALSFVREGKNIRDLKAMMTKLHARPGGLDITGGDLGFSTTYEDDDYIPVISKIEKPQAIENLEEIIEETDAVMVARGDLGVEMDLAEVAILQKKITQMCREHGKPVIVATQMLQSMITEAVPTRAEVSDIANAIMDGTDAIMLSGETAIGKHPVEAVKMMERISIKTNAYIDSEFGHRGKFMKYEGKLNRKAAMARGVNMMARDIEAKFIITWMHSGGSTVFLSQQKNQIPIIAFGENISRLRQTSLLYGIQPIYMKQPKSGSKFITDVNTFLLENKLAKKGDPLIIVASSPITKRGITNRLIIHYVGEEVD